MGKYAVAVAPALWIVAGRIDSPTAEEVARLDGQLDRILKLKAIKTLPPERRRCVHDLAITQIRVMLQLDRRQSFPPKPASASHLNRLKRAKQIIQGSVRTYKEAGGLTDDPSRFLDSYIARVEAELASPPTDSDAALLLVEPHGHIKRREDLALHLALEIVEAAGLRPTDYRRGPWHQIAIILLNLPERSERNLRATMKKILARRA
jgi:hypothetical protein